MQFHPNGKNNAIIWAYTGIEDSLLFHEQEMSASENLLDCFKLLKEQIHGFFED